MPKLSDSRDTHWLQFCAVAIEELSGLIFGEDPPVISSTSTKWEICPECAGNGGTSAYMGDVTDDVLRDPDWADEYFRGTFDRACKPCRGTGKIRAILWEDVSDADFWAIVHALDFRDQCAAEEAAERAMGC